MDLYLAFHKFHQGRIKPEDYYADRNGVIAQMSQLRVQTGPFRIAQLRAGKISEEVIFPRNTGYLYPGYEALEGYTLFGIKDYGIFNAITNEQIRLDIQNVGVIANADPATGRVGLMRYTNSLPRAKFFHHIRAYGDAKSLCSDLDAGRLDFHHEVGIFQEDCLKFGMQTSTPPAEAKATVRFIPKTPDEYQISYETSAPGIIFVSESYCPGWQAEGGRYSVIRAFGAFKGIVIPEAGSGVITVKFVPASLRLGLIISGLSLGLLMVLFGFMLKRDR